MSTHLESHGSIFGAAMMVAGTTIGGGMTALPVLTAGAGFFPSCAIYMLCWAFMLATAYLLVEVVLWHPGHSNYISMARRTLGIFGSSVCWVLYLFLFLSLTVAYMAGGGANLGILLSLPSSWGIVLFTATLAPCVYIGTRAVDRINTVLMVGLFFSFFLFVVSGVFHIHLPYLERAHWEQGLIAAPILFASFGFHGMVPTLTNYLGRDPKKIKKAIFWGSLIPLVTYLMWQGLILGVVSLENLERTRMLGQSAVFSLRESISSRWLSTVGESFSLFAIMTSFLGVTLGLRDFLSDGLRIPRHGVFKVVLMLGIFGIPLLISLLNPCIFLVALDYGAGFSGALLLGLFPLLMAFSGRYILKRKGARLLKGGLLTWIFAFVFLILQLFLMLTN